MDKKRGRPREYLRIDVFRQFEERFNKFMTNDFKHLTFKVNLLVVGVSAVLLAVIAKLIIDFFWM